MMICATIFLSTEGKEVFLPIINKEYYDMNFKVSSSALYSRLVNASKVLANKNVLPILDCFLFDIKDGHITLTAYDGEKYFITQVPVIEHDGDARICINAKTIMDSIKELAEQPISLGFNPSNMTIIGRHSNGTFTLSGMDASVFPLPPALSPDSTQITLPSQVLLDGINRCLFATANDQVRLAMNGIYLDIHPDCIIFASTDSRKLVKSTNTTVQSGISAGIIIHKKVAAILKAVISKDEEDIKLTFDKQRASIETSDSTMHFRLIEARYPNYNGVIPTDNPYTVEVDRLSMVGALKRISIFCSQSTGMITLMLGNNNLTLKGTSDDYSSNAEEYITCEYTQQPISVNFSCHFLLEIVSILDCENVTLNLAADVSRPGLIFPSIQDETDSVLMLLMPMKRE